MKIPNLSSFSAALPRNNTMSFSSPSRVQTLKRFLPLAILLAFVLLVLFLGATMVRNLLSRNSPDTRITIAEAKKTASINREFTFPIKDDKGKEVTKMKYVVQAADVRDEIIVKGQRAIAVKGRTFFIITIKLTNDFDKSIDFFSRDYLRLSINSNKTDLLAADIHNDPVRVQGISTKETRLGFPVNDTDKDFLLLVGDGKNFTTEIPIKF